MAADEVRDALAIEIAHEQEVAGLQPVALGRHALIDKIVDDRQARHVHPADLGKRRAMDIDVHGAEKFLQLRVVRPGLMGNRVVSAYLPPLILAIDALQ
jgi:hypothetical protein